MVDSFHEVRFPIGISYGAVGGPGFMTELNELRSGDEQRNVVWSMTRHSYDVAQGIKTAEEFEETKAFFMARFGRAYGFRFRDWQDYRSGSVIDSTTYSDQPLKNTVTGLYVGDGSTTAFQCVKLYEDAVNPYERMVVKIVDGTYDGTNKNNEFGVAVNGVPLVRSVDYIRSLVTGKVFFTVAPAPGSVVTWGGEFDVPVRFDTDTMQASIDDYNVNSWGSIVLKEIKQGSL